MANQGNRSGPPNGYANPGYPANNPYYQQQFLMQPGSMPVTSAGGQGMPVPVPQQPAGGQPRRKPREKKVLNIVDPSSGKALELKAPAAVRAPETAAAAPAPTAPPAVPVAAQAAPVVAAAAVVTAASVAGVSVGASPLPRKKGGLAIVDPATKKSITPNGVDSSADVAAPKATPTTTAAPTAAAPASTSATPQAAPAKVVTPTPAPEPATAASTAPAAATPATADEGSKSAAAAPAAVPAPLADRGPTYPTGSWKPWDLKGSRVYSIEFLEKFRTVCAKLTAKPKVPELEKQRSSTKDVNVPTPMRRKRTDGAGVEALSFIGGGNTRRTSGKKVISLPSRVEKLEKSENAWNRFGDEEPAAGEEAKVEFNLKKAQGILNKLTVEKFNKLSDELLQLGVEFPEDSMNSFITRIFEKAVDESFFSGMYADLCYKMASTPKPGDTKPLLPDFRKTLLNRCQKEFEKDRKEEKDRLDALEAQKKEKMAKIKAEAETRGTKNVDTLPEAKEVKELDEEEYKLKKDRRRMFGNIKFIGELFLRGMVPEHIIHRQCIEPLINNEQIEEDAFECLCKLLETAGSKLDSTSGKGKEAAGKEMMDKYMVQLTEITRRPGLASRIKFMIQDVIEKRRQGWPRRETGPTTIQEIHKKAERDQIELQRKDAASRSRGGSRPSERMVNRAPLVAAPKERVDKEKIGLKGIKSGAAPTLGRARPSLGKARGGKVQEERTVANTYAALMTEEEAPAEVELEDKDTIARRCKSTIHEYLNIKDKEEVKTCLKEFKHPDAPQVFIETIASVYVDQGKADDRAHLLGLLEALLSDGVIQGMHVCYGLVPILESLDDLATDIPNAPLYLAQIVALCIDKGLINAPYLEAKHVTNMPGEQAVVFILNVLGELRNRTDEATALKFAKTFKKPLPAFLPTPDADRLLELMDRKNVKFLAPLVGGLPSGEGAPAAAAPASAARPDATKLQSEIEGALAKDLAPMQTVKVLCSVVPAAQQDALFTGLVAESVCRKIAAVAASKDGGKLPSEDELKKESECASAAVMIIKEFAKTPESQLHAVYGAQKAANALKFPRGLLHRLFTYYVESDVVPDSVIVDWEKDTSLESVYPGKDTAKRDVAGLLEQLRTPSSD